MMIGAGWRLAVLGEKKGVLHICILAVENEESFFAMKISKENIKERDNNREEMRLWPSEVGWQSFANTTTADAVSMSELRGIIQYHIIREATKDVIFHVLRSSTFLLEKSDGYREYTNRDSGFFAIMGSVLGSSSMRVFIDHKSQIGYRTVEKVIVFGLENAVYENARNIMIVLSDRRLRSS